MPAIAANAKKPLGTSFALNLPVREIMLEITGELERRDYQSSDASRRISVSRQFTGVIRHDESAIRVEAEVYSVRENFNPASCMMGEFTWLASPKAVNLCNSG